MQNDIALIKLKNPVQLNRNIQLACLPNPALPNYPAKTNIQVWNVGWGRLRETDPSIPNTLHNVKLTLYDPIFCTDLTPQVPKNWKTQICAGNFYLKKW